jgi:hypothetical protein
LISKVTSICTSPRRAFLKPENSNCPSSSFSPAWRDSDRDDGDTGIAAAAPAVALAPAAAAVDPLGESSTDLEVLEDDSDLELELDDPSASLAALAAAPHQPVPAPAVDRAEAAPALEAPAAGGLVDAPGPEVLSDLSSDDLDLSNLVEDEVDAGTAEAVPVAEVAVDTDEVEIDLGDVELGIGDVEFDAGTDAAIEASLAEVEPADAALPSDEIGIADVIELEGAADTTDGNAISLVPKVTDENANTLPSGGVVLDEGGDGELGFGDLEEFEIASAPASGPEQALPEAEASATPDENLLADDDADDSLFADAGLDLSSLYEDEEG